MENIENTEPVQEQGIAREYNSKDDFIGKLISTGAIDMTAFVYVPDENKPALADQEVDRKLSSMGDEDVIVVTDHDNALYNLNEKIDRKDKIVDEMESLDDDISELSGSIEDLSQKLVKATAEEIDQIKKEIDEYQSEQNEKKSELGNLRREYDDLKQIDFQQEKSELASVARGDYALLESDNILEQLSNPVEYFVNETQQFSMQDLLLQPFIRIDEAKLDDFLKEKYDMEEIDGKFTVKEKQISNSEFYSEGFKKGDRILSKNADATEPFKKGYAYAYSNEKGHWGNDPVYGNIAFVGKQGNVEKVGEDKFAQGGATNGEDYIKSGAIYKHEYFGIVFVTSADAGDVTFQKIADWGNKNLYSRVMDNELVTVLDTNGHEFTIALDKVSDITGLKFTQNDRRIGNPIMSKEKIKDYLEQLEEGYEEMQGYSAFKNAAKLFLTEEQIRERFDNPEVTVLTISSDNPLSKQLKEITGDSWNANDFSGSTSFGEIITHKKTGEKFTVVNHRESLFVDYYRKKYIDQKFADGGWTVDAEGNHVTTQKDVVCSLDEVEKYPFVVKKLIALNPKHIKREVSGGCNTNYLILSRTYSCEYNLFFVDTSELVEGFMTTYQVKVLDKVFYKAGYEKESKSEAIALVENKIKDLKEKYLDKKFAEGGKTKKYPEKGSPEWHKIKIAKQTLAMTDAGAAVMGGPTKQEAKKTLDEYGIKYSEGGTIYDDGGYIEEIIGQTRSGKPIYANADNEHHKDFTWEDYDDAFDASRKKLTESVAKKEKRTDSDEKRTTFYFKEGNKFAKKRFEFARVDIDKEYGTDYESTLNRKYSDTNYYAYRNEEETIKPFLYLTNKDREKYISKDELREAYKKGKLGSVLKEYDPAAFEEGENNQFAKGGRVKQIKIGDEGMWHGGEVKIKGRDDIGNMEIVRLDEDGKEEGNVFKVSEDSFAEEFANFNVHEPERKNKKYKKGGTIDTDTPIIPEIIAESVAEEKITQYTKIGFTEERAKKSKELQKFLVDRANDIYKKSEHFKKSINASGNKGRDALYMFMRHWSDAYFKTPKQFEREKKLIEKENARKKTERSKKKKRSSALDALKKMND